MKRAHAGLRPKTGSASLSGDGGPTSVVAALKAKLGMDELAAQSQVVSHPSRASSTGTTAMETMEPDSGGVRLSLTNRLKTAAAAAVAASSPSPSPAGSSLGWSLRIRQQHQDISSSSTLGVKKGRLAGSPDKRCNLLRTLPVPGWHSSASNLVPGEIVFSARWLRARLLCK